MKVTAQKGKERFGKVGKLAARFIGPYKIIGRVGEVAYRLDLPEDMHLHPVSMSTCFGDIYEIQVLWSPRESRS